MRNKYFFRYIKIKSFYYYWILIIRNIKGSFMFRRNIVYVIFDGSMDLYKRMKSIGKV